MKNLKTKFLSILLISVMILSSMNVIAAIDDDSALDEASEETLKETGSSDDDVLEDNAKSAGSDSDSKKTSGSEKTSSDDKNELKVTNYTGTYDGKSHNITVKASKSGTQFQYSLDNKTWTKKAPGFKDANGTQTVYIKAVKGDETVYAKGTVTITPVKVTLTAGSASKTYDGTALKSDKYSITKGSFVSGEGLSKVTVSGSQTKVGSSKNKITKYSFKSNTKAQNYDITLKTGTLTVKKAKTPYKNETKNNNTNKTNTTAVPLKNTGIPVLVLAFSMFVIVTLVKRD